MFVNKCTWLVQSSYNVRLFARLCCRNAIMYVVREDLSFIFVFTDMAEILSKKEISGKNIYYIHYDDCKYKLKDGHVIIKTPLQKSLFASWSVKIVALKCRFKLVVNKRLDEWVGEDRMNLDKLEQPKKEVKTPSKDGKMLNGSRPSSPERELVVCILGHIFTMSLIKPWTVVRFHPFGVSGK